MYQGKINNKKFIMQLVVIAGLLVASGFVAYNSFLKPQKFDIGAELLVNDQLILSEDENIEEQIISDASDVQSNLVELLNSLSKFGNWPLVVDPNTIGRINPFIPPL
jgi:hypothetical protein